MTTQLRRPSSGESAGVSLESNGRPSVAHAHPAGDGRRVRRPPGPDEPADRGVRWTLTSRTTQARWTLTSRTTPGRLRQQFDEPDDPRPLAPAA